MAHERQARNILPKILNEGVRSTEYRVMSGKEVTWSLVTKSPFRSPPVPVFKVSVQIVDPAKLQEIADSFSAPAPFG